MMPLPPWDYDIQTYARFYAEAWNNWNGTNPDSDPRRIENFVKFARALGKDTTDLSALGGPAWNPAPPPVLSPLSPPPDPPEINTRFGRPPALVEAAIAATWPLHLWVSAAEVAYKESSWRPEARNNTLHIGPCGTQYQIPGIGPAMTEDSRGLFQVNVCAHGGGDDLYDPLTNAAKGYSIYQRQGWRAWYYSATALGLL